MAPPFRLTIEKYYNGEYWVNVYWLNVATLSAGGPPAEAIYNAERAIHLTGITFTKYRLDDATPNTDQYITVVKNQLGQRVPSGDPVPLFVTARFDMSTTVGRPSRKYFRGVLTEADLAGYGTIEAASATSLQNAWSVPILAVDEYVDVDMTAFTTAALFPFANVRQLRRGSKKKLTP